MALLWKCRVSGFLRVEEMCITLSNAGTKHNCLPEFAVLRGNSITDPPTLMLHSSNKVSLHTSRPKCGMGVAL